jgi:hypothetical protein
MKKYKKDREALKLDLKEILETEDIEFWNEQRIKEYYDMGHIYTRKLAHSLIRLGIPIRRVNEYVDEDGYDYGYNYFDLEEDFVEKVLAPPKGWMWCDGLLEKTA